MDVAQEMDRGYAWIILIAAFILYMLAFGMLKAFGMLYLELMSVYEGGAGATMMVGSLAQLVQSFLSPPANSLCEEISFRAILVTGSLMLSLGFFLSIFAKTLTVMFLTYGIIVGTGFGLTFAPTATIVNFYFEKRRAFANGVTVSASGIGFFLFQYLYRILFDTYGTSGCFLIISAILLNCVVAALLIRQPIQLKKTTSSSAGVSSVKKKSYNVFAVIKKVFKFRADLFRNCSVIIYIVMFPLALLGYGANYYIIPIHLSSLGYDENSVMVAMAVMGGSEVVSRIVVGWITDLQIVSESVIFCLCMLVGGLSAILVSFTPDYNLICLYVAVVGIFPGSFYTQMPVIIVRNLGLKNLLAAYSLVTVFLAVAFVSGMPCIGLLKDLTGNWNASFCAAGVVLIISGSLAIVDKLLQKRKKDTIQKEKSKESEKMIVLKEEEIACSGQEK